MTSVTFNGLTYNIPGTADQAWSGSSGVDGFLIAVANNSFQKTGGLFTLAADSDFGPTNGTVQVYFKSRSSNIASAGVLRLAVGDAIKWRNNANNADLALAVNASDQLTFAGNVLSPATGAYTQYGVLYAATTGTISSTAAGTSGYLLTSNATSAPTYQQLNLGTSAAITGQLPFGNIANVAANSLMGNNTGSPAAPISLSAAQVNTLLGSLSNPMTTLGDLIYGGASGATTRLAGDTSNTRKFLRELSSGGVAAAPAWDTLTGSDLPNPSASTLGGIQSLAAVAHKWINTISTSGVPSATQPAFSDISGSIANTQCTAPTVQVFTTSGAGTYNRPAGVLYIRVQFVGAGGGGGASTTNAGGNGGDSIFNSIHAAGGSGGNFATPNYIGGAGGTGGTGTADFRIQGGGGHSAGGLSSLTGGNGGSSFFGGGAPGSGYNQPGQNAAANSGAGGSGGNNAGTLGSGGGAGEYVELTISNPASSYSYTVGAKGAGGAAGAQAGGNGGDGIIIVREYYQ